MRLKPYYDTPAPAPVSEATLDLKTPIKLESGSGSEKENDVRTSGEKKRKRSTSTDSEGATDPDFEPKVQQKSTKPVEVKRESKEHHNKEHKDKRREKEKKKKKDKDRDRDRDKERTKDYDKHRDRDKNGHHHHRDKKEKLDTKPDNTKLSFKMSEPQSFEKLISESKSTPAPTSGKKSVDERRNMSQLFPGQIKAESVKKKLALTPQTSPKIIHKPSEHHVKKPDTTVSPVKKILNFDNPSKNVNILDQIMSNMSFPANKE